MNKKQFKRFFLKVRKTKKCWIWKAYRNPMPSGGYGRFRIGNKMFVSHRVSYEHFKNKVNNGFELHHICNNRSCVNPKHLVQVTHKENMALGYDSKNNWNRKKTHCKYGHKFDKSNITIFITKEGYKKRTCKKCHREWDRKNYVHKFKPKIFCKYGHKFDKENTRIYFHDGYKKRGCKRCNRINAIKRYHLLKDSK